MQAIHYYTKEQVRSRICERFRLYNSVEKKPLTLGLTDEQIAFLGDLMMALNEYDECETLTSQQYETNI